ncbi:hypothetical protein QTG54_015118 [Skeletonema marinoi]|uniref:Uncharacterized protein n=1 Tax=Skeletonema marinoi TaxID=267567 RepID=A0AAD9D5Y0_9STRA|nr:hypothetical protein QTG54_015118 [Skeletonema marinoi]
MSNTHEVHLDDNDDAEDIELVGGSLRRQRASPPSLPSCPVLFGRILLLFLIALIVGYKLGMEEGKAEVQEWMNGAMIESNSKEFQEIHEALNSLALEFQQVIDHEDSTSQIQNETEALETTTTTTTSPSP